MKIVTNFQKITLNDRLQIKHYNYLYTFNTLKIPRPSISPNEENKKLLHEKRTSRNPDPNYPSTPFVPRQTIDGPNNTTTIDQGPEIKKKPLVSNDPEKGRGLSFGSKKKKSRKEKAIKRRSRFELVLGKRGYRFLATWNSSVGPFYFSLPLLLLFSLSRSRQLEDRFIAGEEVHRFGARLASLRAVFYVGRRCDSGDSHTYN